jgi:hypothetical protein
VQTAEFENPAFAISIRLIFHEQHVVIKHIPRLAARRPKGLGWRYEAQHPEGTRWAGNVQHQSDHYKQQQARTHEFALR